MRNEHKAQSFIAFFTSTSQLIIMVFNTGETSEELKAKYNPEGSLLRRVQLRMLDMLLYFDTVCKEQHISYRLDGGTWVQSDMEVSFLGMMIWTLPLTQKKTIKSLYSISSNTLMSNLCFRTRKQILDSTTTGSLSVI